jgi:hypothetical protein
MPNCFVSNYFADSFHRYAQLFAWIVKAINNKIDPNDAEVSIGILDIFGFENFQVILCCDGHSSLKILLPG